MNHYWNIVNSNIRNKLPSNLPSKLIHFHSRKCILNCRRRKIAALLSRPQCVNRKLTCSGSKELVPLTTIAYLYPWAKNPCENARAKLEWPACDQRMRHSLTVNKWALCQKLSSSEIWFVILNCQLVSHGTKPKHRQDYVATHIFLNLSPPSQSLQRELPRDAIATQVYTRATYVALIPGYQCKQRLPHELFRTCG